MTRQGKVLFAHVEVSKDRADQAAQDYRESRRNVGNWSIRIFPRTVRANSVAVPVWVVIVREKRSSSTTGPMSKTAPGVSAAAEAGKGSSAGSATDGHESALRGSSL